MSTDDELLSLEQIAKETGLPLRTLYTQRSAGTGPRGFRLGKHIRVRRSEYEKWLESHRDDQPQDAA